MKWPQREFYFYKIWYLFVCLTLAIYLYLCIAFIFASICTTVKRINTGNYFYFPFVIFYLIICYIILQISDQPFFIMHKIFITKVCSNNYNCVYINFLSASKLYNLSAPLLAINNYWSVGVTKRFGMVSLTWIYA